MPKTDPAREALLTALEASGVSIPLWDGILIEETVRIAPGATILPGCVLRGNTTIAAGSVIGPGSVLTDAVIGKNCIVKNTYITESTLEENVSIGRFPRLQYQSRRPRHHRGRRLHRRRGHRHPGCPRGRHAHRPRRADRQARSGPPLPPGEKIISRTPLPPCVRGNKSAARQPLASLV